MEREELLKFIDKAREALQVVPPDSELFPWWQRRLAGFTKLYTKEYGEVPRIEKDVIQSKLF